MCIHEARTNKTVNKPICYIDRYFVSEFVDEARTNKTVNPK